MISSFFRQLPFANKLAIYTAALSLCTCLFLIAASQQQIHSINEISLEQLGSQLSKQLAINARPALIQADSLSLQSMLVELASSELIHQAVIFDIDNKPIAEAGKRIDGKAYMAPIHYQDTIAGHSLIVLNIAPINTQTTGLLLQQLLLSLLLSACCYAFSLWMAGKLSGIFDRLSQLIAAPNYPSNTKRVNIAYFGQDALQQLIAQTLKGPNPESQKQFMQELALLHISFDLKDGAHALEQLQQHQQQLNTIGKLYDGSVEVTRPNSLTVVFYQNKTENDHPFKALCCGKIIEQLFSCGENALSFKATAILAEHCDDYSKHIAIEKACQMHSNTLLTIDESILNHVSVKDRIEQLDERVEDEGQLIHFNPPYSELIERQFKTLKLQFERQ